MMIDLCGARRPARASARRISGSDIPPSARPPICRKLRRETPSQKEDWLPGMVITTRTFQSAGALRPSSQESPCAKPPATNANLPPRRAVLKRTSASVVACKTCNYPAGWRVCRKSGASAQAGRLVPSRPICQLRAGILVFAFLKTNLSQSRGGRGERTARGDNLLCLFVPFPRAPRASAREFLLQLFWLVLLVFIAGAETEDSKRKAPAEAGTPTVSTATGGGSLPLRAVVTQNRFSF
jgi:hypothetical protein